jgi:lysyl-tRNA synthetase class I
MSMQRQLPDKAGHADPWTLCCAECGQIMRIMTAKPARKGTETRTYECACGHREILDVPLH